MTRNHHLKVFSRILRERLWGSEESVSGPGSTRGRAATFVPALIELLSQLEVRTLLDAPCGDFNWADDLANAVDTYIGVDIIPELIERNQVRHAAPNRTFLTADLTRDPLPKGDLILCRDCLVHFSYADIRAAVANFRRSGVRYLLTTTFLDRRANEDIVTGGWRVLNLEAPPFRFPPPLALVDEHCTHTGGIYRDKRLALWDIAALP